MSYFLWSIVGFFCFSFLVYIYETITDHFSLTKFKKSFEIGAGGIQNLFEMNLVDNGELAKELYEFNKRTLERFIRRAKEIKYEAKKAHVLKDSSYWIWCYQSTVKLVKNLDNNVADAYCCLLRAEDIMDDSKSEGRCIILYTMKNFLSITNFDDYNGFKILNICEL